MAIIGILIAALTASFESSLLKGNDARRKSDLKQLQSALEAYMNDYGQYPPAGSNGEIAGCSTSGQQICAWGSPWQNDKGTIYMSKLPQEIRSSIKYLYVVSSTHTMYQLFATLDNTQDTSNVKTYIPGCGGASPCQYSTNCGTSATIHCTYGVSSSNTNPAATLN